MSISSINEESIIIDDNILLSSSISFIDFFSIFILTNLIISVLLIIVYGVFITDKKNKDLLIFMDIFSIIYMIISTILIIKGRNDMDLLYNNYTTLYKNQIELYKQINTIEQTSISLKDMEMLLNHISLKFKNIQKLEK